jgi:hypothetical protein
MSTDQTVYTKPGSCYQLFTCNRLVSKSSGSEMVPRGMVQFYFCSFISKMPALRDCTQELPACNILAAPPQRRVSCAEEETHALNVK